MGLYTWPEKLWNLLEVNCNLLNKTEIKKTIKALKRGKAEGPDEIPAEALDADIETLTI